jgi:hypothetical protein
VARAATGAARLEWRRPRLAARGIRVQIDAGFVNLATQFAPLVRRQAATAAALFLLLGCLAPLIVAARILLLELARVDTLLWHALDTLLVALDRLHLLILGLAAVTIAFLAERRRGGTSGSNANDQRAGERQPAAKPSSCWCMDGGVRVFHSVPLPRCRINR